MQFDRRATRLLVVLSATPWAAGWTVLGLWILLVAPSSVQIGSFEYTMPGMLRFTAGLTSLAAGQLVFMCFVCDRLFPRAHRPAVWTAQLTASGAIILGAVALCFQVLWIYAGGAA